ncbi:MAG TPA: allantoinase AllB [Acidimicrobiia bacterium]|jgi:allantoinase|nr:allantoinase AllB [Acidimicrobiia bacterium]
MTDDLVVRGTRVALPVGLQPAAVTVTGGRITGVVGHGDGPAGANVLDAGDRLVFPGLVDSHVHVNEPGRTSWEGFATATRAASAGGTTAIVDMPLNSIPPTIDRASLAAKRRAAVGQCAVDVAFWGGLTPDSVDEIEALAGEGVCGFKAFLVDSGVSEFPPVSEDVLRKALPKLGALGLPLLVHAELPGLIRNCPSGGSYLDHLAARPSAAEDGAVKMLTDLVEETGAAVHILHLASGDAVELLAAAQKRGLPITAETCPHYLVFAAEDIDPRATLFKCAPPIRERRHRELLWEGMAAGTVGMVVSDHSPAPPEMKQSSGDFAAAWGGISSLQLRLAATWTAAAARGIAVEKLVGWLATAPARLAGLDKGTIEPGKDADLIVWDPDAEFTVEPAGLHHRHPLSPYEGMTMRGVVETTIVRGRVVARNGEVVSQNGALLAREHR